MWGACEVAGHDGATQELDPEALERDSMAPPMKDVIDNALVVGQLMRTLVDSVSRLLALAALAAK